MFSSLETIYEVNKKLLLDIEELDDNYRGMGNVFANTVFFEGESNKLGSTI